MSLFAGNTAGGNVDATGAAASFIDPNGVAIAADGSLYVADSANDTIRKVTAAGIVTTFAGSWFAGSSDGTGTAARFHNPLAIAIDAGGTLYVGGDGVIRKVSPSAVVSTFAGADGVPGSADGQGSSARFGVSPSGSGIALDTSGNVYVSDSPNNTIRKIDASGNVTTFAGTAGVTGSADGTGPMASFSFPWGIAVDGSGNLFVADAQNYTIRKITPAGVVSTFAGTAGMSGTADGTGAAARFSFPTGLTFNSTGNLYVTDNNAIRSITPAGVVTTFAGSATAGHADGSGSAASFNNPVGMAFDATGNLFVVDSTSGTLRKVTPAGLVTTFAGTPALGGGLGGLIDGTGSAARFFGPEGLATDSAGNVYVADTFDSAVRKISPSGAVSTLLPPVLNQYRQPSGLAIDTGGNLYVADSFLNTIGKLTPAGVFTVFAGSGTAGSADGTGAAASFNSPSAIAVDSGGTLYVADSGNNTIRNITSEGVVTTLAGTPGTTGHADGVGAAASFNFPEGIAVDASGNIFVSDSINNTIREISPGGTVTTLAGMPGVESDADGTGAAAGFYFPFGIMIDTSGDLLVADYGNATIRKVTKAGVVTTVAGVAGTRSFQSGALPGLLCYPAGLVRSGTTLYATMNNAVIQITNFP